MTHVRFLGVLLLAGLVGAGCAGSELQKRKEGAWGYVPQSEPDSSVWHAHPQPLSIFQRKITEPGPEMFDPLPSGYGHPLRGLGFAAHPVGVALDYALVQPFYILSGLAPEWFGLSSEDAYRFQGHFPELSVSREAPPRFE